jgi:amino acid adenylation domain-containing protein
MSAVVTGRELLALSLPVVAPPSPDDAACVHALFEAQAARTPDAVAVAWEDERVSYAELNARANRLAHRLRALGVGPDARVGVCLERTPEMVAALLGVLKAGGAYVPIDPVYPAERIGYMLEDSSAGVLVTQDRVAGRLPAHRGTLVVMDADAELASSPATNPAPTATARALSHVIYTSGSTGRPKGVMVEHGNTVAFLRWMRAAFPVAEGQRILGSTSISFDVSIAEVFHALSWGGTLVLVENALHLAFLRDRDGVQQASMVPAAAAELARMDGIPRSVRTLNLAGEALPAALAQQLYERTGVERIFNCYGPTEDTTYSTVTLVERGAPRVTIGRPIEGSTGHVLDPSLSPVEEGEAGELFLGGAGVTRGYLDRPAMTAERFVPDPWGAPGGRMYRTGDLVRRNGAGELEYLGRLDHQVKIRGFRVEVGEVENALLQRREVASAVVTARADGRGDTRLVAYVVPAYGARLDSHALKAALKEVLPEYMVPSAYVPMEVLPLSPNGKVDRKKLPVPPAASYAGDGAHVPPRTPTQEALAEVWCDVLGVARVGEYDDFFDLGGHSLLGMQVTTRIRQIYGVRLPVRALFDAPTLAELAERVDAAVRQDEVQRQPALVPVPRDGALPLSFAQQRLWFLHQLDPRGASYNIPAVIHARGAMDMDALRRALAEVLRRHEALRTVFRAGPDGPVQVVLPPVEPPVPFDDLRELPENDLKAETKRRVERVARTPFDLGRDLMLRARVLRVGDAEHLLVLALHHVAGDGWSVNVLFREIAALYGAFAQGEPSPLPEPPVQYADFAAWQRRWLAGDALESQMAYWRRALDGAPTLLEVPAPKPRPPVQSFRGDAYPVALPKGLVARLRALGRSDGATLFMTLLAAWEVVVARCAGQEDVVVGSPIAGRVRAEVEGLIGFFANTLVLRTDFGGDPTFRQILGRVREATLEAYSHPDLPFERLVEALHPERSLAHNPLFQVGFALHHDPVRRLEAGGVRFALEDAHVAAAKFDLSLELTERGETVAGKLEYATDLFDADAAGRLAERFLVVLDAVAGDPDLRLSRIPLLTAEERERVLHTWNLTDATFSRDRCIHHLFEEMAARHPDVDCVRDRGAVLSYGEVERRANRLARRLAALGVGPEARVGVCLPRGADLVAALVGVLKAGGAYVTLDPAYPAERLQGMAADADVTVLLTAAKHGQALEGAGLPTLRLDSRWWRGAEAEAAPFPSPAMPECPAYVIYTSGSTGKPKGVAVPHAGLVNLLEDMQRRQPVGPGDRCLAWTSPSFDVSAYDLFSALTTGACVVLVPDDRRTVPADLVRWMGEEAISSAYVPPFALPELATWLRDHPGASRLRRLLVGVEPIPEGLLAAIRDRVPGLRVFNGYGPTETTVYSTLFPVEGEVAEERTTPIGHPIANTQVYLLDRHLRPVPIGVAGELYVGGAGVARGYLNRPGQTAERFLPDPYGGRPGARLYRTGDLARHEAGGAIHFLGRIDRQVKLRGFRIELGEVETTLAERDEVGEAVVVVRDEGGDRRLVGYVVPAPGPRPVPAAELAPSLVPLLRGHLRTRLPEYMVPSALVVLDALPLTPNGKIDRRALPAPEPVGRAAQRVPPRNDTERTLAGIFRDLLRLEGDLGIDENFFDLGGHSLLATQLVTRVREALGVEMCLASVFEQPTVAGLALVVDALNEEVLAALMAELDSMSDDDARAALAAQGLVPD